MTYRIDCACGERWNTSSVVFVAPEVAMHQRVCHGAITITTQPSQLIPVVQLVNSDCVLPEPDRRAEAQAHQAARDLAVRREAMRRPRL